jgi:HAD superfamily hydrolase (TIGR01458 family)
MALTHIEGLLLDMDGVLGVSWRPLPGAAAAVARLRTAGLPLRVITSTTAKSRRDIGSGLREHGFDVADDDLLSASVLAAAYLRTAHPEARVFLLGDAQPADLEGVRLVSLDDEPQVVLVSGADESFAFDTLTRVYRALLGGASLVAMHRNLSWMTHEGERLDAGAYLMGLERASGREAVVTGKPAPACFVAGLEALGLSAARVAMVGDDVENDVLAAQAVGITGVLVRTGKFREEKLAAASGKPDHVIDSLVDLPDLLGC